MGNFQKTLWHRLTPHRGYEPSVCHRLNYAFDGVGFRRRSHEFINPSATTHVFGAFAKLGKSQHDPADDYLFLGAEIPKGFLGRFCNCAFDTAAIAKTAEE